MGSLAFLSENFPEHTLKRQMARWKRNSLFIGEDQVRVLSNSTSPDLGSLARPENRTLPHAVLLLTHTTQNHVCGLASCGLYLPILDIRIRVNSVVEYIRTHNLSFKEECNGMFICPDTDPFPKQSSRFCIGGEERGRNRKLCLDG